ncbi:hypothetical protein AZE42_07516 [Rhizopogon vesiculosus]|uniref:Uncharacterized protein n=1 Tax=Rhizopogon vesiculosus TaxID=180088 RepID=A0A1J8PSW2_9AGAM|nr:hypothetical protein AZE42_07516 [Rhizopogon vesiculosus]
MPKGRHSYKSSQELEDKIQHACSVLHASSSPNIRAVGSRRQKRTFNEGPSDENDQNVPPAMRPRPEIIPFHSAITPSYVGPSSTPHNILATSSSHSAFEPI